MEKITGLRRAEEEISSLRTILEKSVEERTAELEQERRAHLWFLESMDRVNRAMQGTKDLEQVMGNVLDVLLSIFDCDRVALVYPCDPEASSWRVPMERTRPEYPGVHALGIEMPMEPDVALKFRTLMESNGPVKFGPGYEHQLPAKVAERFGFQSFIAMALHPKIGMPWEFMLHQCSYPRVWTVEEERLFQEVGRRLTDTLTNLLTYRNLEESEALLKITLDLAKLVHWEYDVQTGMFSFDEQFYSLYGTTAEREGGPLMSAEVYARRFIPPEEASLVGAEIAKSLASNDPGFTNQLEHRIIRADGEERHISVSYMVVCDQEGRIIKTRGANQDITGRKKAEEALRQNALEYQRLAISFNEKQRLLHSLIDSIPDLIFYKDQESVYLGCNKAFEDFAGKSEESLIGLTDLDIFPSKVADFFREMDRKMLSQQKARRNEEWVDYPDGRRILLDTLKTPFYDQDGKVLGLIGISRDITEQRLAKIERERLEAQLQHAQKMEAIGVFAGGIAHDFNNMLTAIIGYADILLRRIGKENPLRRYSEQIFTAAKRAAELTDGLLAFSRKQVLNPKPIDLCDVVRGLGNMLERLIPEDIEFKTLTAAKDLIVLADRGQIEQVLMNLATNARDAMPGGGSLTIEINRADMEERFAHAHGSGEPGYYACISVTDTGHGMDEETRKKIFEPFFTTKEVGKGTGLGMAIIYGIIKQHKGYINVYSEPDRGTTFRVYLPLIAGDEIEVQDSLQMEPPSGGTETILLAEDDLTVRELHRIILEEAGYKVIEAVDGRDALDKFIERQEEVDIVATDVIMPKLDGKSLREEIRRIRPETKFLFISGYTKNTVLERGILDGDLDFIAKPVTSFVLLKKVREILDYGNSHL